MAKHKYSPEELLIRQKAQRALMYWSLVSIVMFFGGFVSYRLVARKDSGWLQFDVPEIFFISTAVILLSSLTLYLGQGAIKKGNLQQTKLFLIATLLLGLYFTFTQFQAWGILMKSGIFLAGKQANNAGSIFYIIVYLHLAHMIAAIFSLIYTLNKTFKNGYSSTDYHGITLTSIFWHFLGILWVILFLFLYFIH